MITAYALIASLIIGFFVRHNLAEILDHIREYKIQRRVRRDMKKLMKKADELDKTKTGASAE